MPIYDHIFIYYDSVLPFLEMIYAVWRLNANWIISIPQLFLGLCLTNKPIIINHLPFIRVNASDYNISCIAIGLYLEKIRLFCSYLKLTTSCTYVVQEVR